MDGSLRHAKTSHRPVSVSPTDVKQTTTISGYEQSDAETEFPESEWTVDDEIKKDLREDEELESVGNNYSSTKSRYTNRDSSTMRHRHEPDATLPHRTALSNRSRTSHSKSPHSLRHREVQKHDSGIIISHGKAKGDRHHVSPYKHEKEDNQDQHAFDEKEFASSLRRQKYVKNNEIKAASHRSSSAPRPRLKEKESYQYDDNDGKKKEEKTKINRVPSSLRSRDSSRNRIENDGYHKHMNSYQSGEINEMIANAKISRASTANVSNYGTIDSMVPDDDLFFTQDYASIGTENKYHNQRPKRNPATSDVVSSHQTKTKYSSPALNRQQPHHHKINNEFSSTKTADRNPKLVTNRQKIQQEETCFPCIRNGYCTDSRKSPEKGRAHYEATIIQKTFVVENVRQFWADKHQPAALSGFTCQKQKALLLRTLASIGIFPHILFKGPPGSGKKALTMALLREIFGPSVWNVSHELRYFGAQEARPMEVAVLISSSPHHVELNVNSKSNVTYALMALFKHMSSDHRVPPETSTVDIKPNYKVLALYDVDKADDRIQHLIKWIMDFYADSCKLILCCEDDENILESVRSHCKVIDLEAPVSHEIMEVLSEIARKEKFELPMSFAAKIANKSMRNLRIAIMALEACKANNYPFAEDQPIPVGWENVLVELASELLADPSPDKLFMVRGQLRKLLASFVHEKLILLKLVQEFLKGADASAKRELYYWHAYYDKRLPSGTSALLKLEEFIAKFMSMHRKSHSHRLNPCLATAT